MLSQHTIRRLSHYTKVDLFSVDSTPVCQVVCFYIVNVWCVLWMCYVVYFYIYCVCVCVCVLLCVFIYILCVCVCVCGVCVNGHKRQVNTYYVDFHMKWKSTQYLSTRPPFVNLLVFCLYLWCVSGVCVVCVLCVCCVCDCIYIYICECVCASVCVQVSVCVSVCV